MFEYRVGALYLPGRTSWPEATDYNYRAGGHELRLFWRDPSAREIGAIKSGQASFALVVTPPAITLLYRFGDLPWSDQPYSIWLVPEDQRTLPPPTETAEPHAILSVILVDATTGLIRALRAVSLSPAFTAALHLAIRDQHAAGWPGDDAYNRAVRLQQARYPTSNALLRAAIARTEGGR